MADKRQELHDSRPIQASSAVVYAVPVYAAPGGGAGGSVGASANTGAPATVEAPSSILQPLNSNIGGVAAAPTTFHAIPQATIVGVVQTNYFGSQPQRIICQYCGADVITGVRVTVSFLCAIDEWVTEEKN
jgi:hypothetical protein